MVERIYRTSGAAVTDTGIVELIPVQIAHMIRLCYKTHMGRFGRPTLPASKIAVPDMPRPPRHDPVPDIGASRQKHQTSSPLYTAIADRRPLHRRHRGGTLAPGERSPSVRRIAAEEQVLVATILQALAQLERLGLVEAPARGRATTSTLRAAPPRPAPRPRPAPLLRSRPGAGEIYLRSHNASIVQLGSPSPRRESLPGTACSRALASWMRSPATAAAYQMPPACRSSAA